MTCEGTGACNQGRHPWCCDCGNLVTKNSDGSSRTPEKIDSVCSALRAELAKPTKPVELVEPVAWVVLADVDGRMVPQYPPRSDKESAEKDALMFKKTKTAVMPLCLHPPTPTPATAPVMNINSSQIAQLAQFACAGDALDEPTDICVQSKPAGKDTDGEDAKAGLYAWLAEYAEEGMLFLDPDTPTPAPATAPEPAWHDAPTEPGLWFNSINHYADIVSQHWIDRGVVANSHARWYGPIPQDAKAEGDAIKKGG